MQQKGRVERICSDAPEISSKSILQLREISISQSECVKLKKFRRLTYPIFLTVLHSHGRFFSRNYGTVTSDNRSFEVLEASERRGEEESLHKSSESDATLTKSWFMAFDLSLAGVRRVEACRLSQSILAFSSQHRGRFKEQLKGLLFVSDWNLFWGLRFRCELMIRRRQGNSVLVLLCVKLINESLGRRSLHRKSLKEVSRDSNGVALQLFSFNRNRFCWSLSLWKLSLRHEDSDEEVFPFRGRKTKQKCSRHHDDERRRLLFDDKNSGRCKTSGKLPLAY